MVHQFLELYVDFGNPWLLFNMKSNDSVERFDLAKRETLKSNRRFVQFEMSRDDLYSFELASVCILKSDFARNNDEKKQVDVTGTQQEFIEKSIFQLGRPDSTFVLSLTDKFIFLKPQTFEAIMKKLCLSMS